MLEKSKKLFFINASAHNIIICCKSNNTMASNENKVINSNLWTHLIVVHSLFTVKLEIKCEKITKETIFKTLNLFLCRHVWLFRKIIVKRFSIPNLVNCYLNYGQIDKVFFFWETVWDKI